MKFSTKILSTASLACVLCAGAAQADGWYAGVSGDLTWLQHTDMGGGVNADLGYRFDPNVRVEGEFGYHGAPGESGYSNAHYFTYMGNAYYDFNALAMNLGNGLHMVPYLGAGIGVAEYSYGDQTAANTFNHHDTDFAYQGMAGLTFVADSMPNVDWVAGYRYTGAGDSDIEASNIEVGLRYHF